MSQQRPALLLIDSASSGCAGAYLDALYRGLGRNPAVDVAVSHYFPFDYGHKWFFKFSELAAQPRYGLGKTRLYVRYLELCVAFARLLFHLWRRRIGALCYAISSNLRLEYAFLFAVKRLLGARVLLICHDVVPFVLPGQSLEDMVRTRRRFYELADQLIVHNENSVADLRDVFGIDGDRVTAFPFPIYDLASMNIREVEILPPARAKRFLFIGHLRPEKGVNVLLQAWSRFQAATPDAELVVAGNVPAGCYYDFDSHKAENLRLIPSYLGDAEYVALIKAADCVVLPYLRGTNSAVASTVLALRKNLIVSDIGMFANNPLIPAECFFRCGDAAALAERLTFFAGQPAQSSLLLGANVHERFAAYDRAFNARLDSVFGDYLRSS